MNTAEQELIEACIEMRIMALEHHKFLAQFPEPLRDVRNHRVLYHSEERASKRLQEAVDAVIAERGIKL